MTVKLNRKQVLAISRLDFTGLGHSQRLDLIAKALGMRNQATMMSVLKTQKSEEHVNDTKHADEPLMTSDADDLISQLLAGRLGPTLSRRLNLFVAPTWVDQEAFALRLASRMLAETYVAPTVMVIRDEDSARKAARLSQHGPVFGCMHGGDAKSGVIRLRSFGVDTDENPVLGNVSILRDATADPGYVSICMFPMHTSGEDLKAFRAKTEKVAGGLFDRTGIVLQGGLSGTGRSQTFDKPLKTHSLSP